MAEAKWANGMFCWRELMTDDVDRARAFHGELFGWGWKADSMGAAGTYWLISKDGQYIGGIMAKPPGAPMPSAWSSYVLVDDVDAATKRCAAAGGTVYRAPDDVPDIGRFAVLADPWGAVFLPYRPFGESKPPAPGANTFCWESLVTPDPKAAIAFYGKVVGFGTGPTPNGEGTLFTAGGTGVADLQPARSGAPSYWATYVQVERAEATRDRAVQLGGKVVVPRIDVPQVGVVAFIADPSGAALGLFQPVR
jgi:predicted enzyme related to lactoylglutathione lyase